MDKCGIICVWFSQIDAAFVHQGMRLLNSSFKPASWSPGGAVSEAWVIYGWKKMQHQYSVLHIVSFMAVLLLGEVMEWTAPIDRHSVLPHVCWETRQFAIHAAPYECKLKMVMVYNLKWQKKYEVFFACDKDACVTSSAEQ